MVGKYLRPRANTANMTKVLYWYNNQERKDQEQNSIYKPNSAVKHEFNVFKILKFTVLTYRYTRHRQIQTKPSFAKNFAQSKLKLLIKWPFALSWNPRLRFSPRFPHFFFLARNCSLCQLWTMHMCIVHGPTNYTF